MDKIIEKCVEIKEPVFKQGMGAKGEWSLAKIVTDKGKEASVFNPVVTGDAIELTYNEQYKNWSGKVMRQPQRNFQQPQNQSSDISKIINLIYEQNKEILDKVNDLLGLSKPEQKISMSNIPLDEDKIDLKDIPF